MELHQLEYFVAVAEEASFTRAAARLRVAQPGVSAQIRRLERDLGEELFDRAGRAVRLTEVGQAVLPYARTALGAVDGARQAVDELVGLIHGRVAVGMVVACSGLDLPEVLAAFHKERPGVRITLSEANSRDLLDDLAAGLLDLAVVALAAEPPAGVATAVIVDEPVVLAVCSDDPLADRTHVRLADIRDRPLVCLPRGTGLRGCIEAACAAAGFQPQVAFEASDPTVVAQLAARGLGPAVLPPSIVTAYPELRGLSTDPPMRGQLALAWRARGPASPAARALTAYARSVMLPASTRS